MKHHRPGNPKNREPNYLRKLAYLQRLGAFRPGVQAVEVAHDDSCGIFQGQPCNCHPDVHIRWQQPAGAQH